MKAAVYYETGAPDVFRYEDVPDPQLHPNGVLIDVKAIGIEGGDVLNRAGGDMPRKPHIVGYNCAGVVREVGASVTDRKPGDRVMTLTRESSWTLVSSTPVKFQTFHPQGMVRVGDALFVSSVEVSVRTKRVAQPVGGYDRDTGEGVGHLFKMDLQGNLVSAIRLGEGSIYHPGGIDYDGTSVWVPVAEYRA